MIIVITTINEFIRAYQGELISAAVNDNIKGKLTREPFKWFLMPTEKVRTGRKRMFQNQSINFLKSFLRDLEVSESSI